MYLKSIEVQGFKSFAHKIKFDFHNGITGIVGPNGSGKSNVSDAVRWVFGEQSAKQLRGGSMQDVIFAGTQLRKPQSYAAVKITLDNSDHALNIDYPEVSVTRKLYRSGESEYLINDNPSRLRDIQELFYDTGIGKDGYSIIGQGQIDKILSGKADERRELFDEACGIVKFKKRKNQTLKKLESEHASMLRLTDIVSELEKQAGPLKRQSETAKVYLKLRDELKVYDLNAFLIDHREMTEKLAVTEKNLEITLSELGEKQEAEQKLREQYADLDEHLTLLDQKLVSLRERHTEASTEKSQIEGQINVVLEQINAEKMRTEHYDTRTEEIEKDILAREEAEKTADRVRDEKLSEKEKLISESLENGKVLSELEIRINLYRKSMEESHGKQIDLLTERNETNARFTALETLISQHTLRQEEIHTRLSEITASGTKLAGETDVLQAELQELQNALSEKEEELQSLRDELSEAEQNYNRTQRDINDCAREYQVAKSRLDTLRSMAERYEGFNQAVRRIMDVKHQYHGIEGVVADLIHVNSKYTVAVETALGGSIQNVVTETEDTAKKLVSYLKENRAGRATFLPLDSIRPGKSGYDAAVFREPGCIGTCDTLVETDARYTKVVRYLLNRFLVFDTIDHALAAAKKYRYTLRIVTLEGDFLSVGGSITGGAYKNSSNLLSRTGELDQLAKDAASYKERGEALQKKLNQFRQIKESTDLELEDVEEEIRESKTAISEKRTEMDVKNRSLLALQLEKKEQETRLSEITTEIEDAKREIEVTKETIKELESAGSENTDSQEEAKKNLEEVENEFNRVKERAENLSLRIQEAEQNAGFQEETKTRLKREITKLREDLSDLETSRAEALETISRHEAEIEELKVTLSGSSDEETALSEKVRRYAEEREKLNQSQHAFFDQRDSLNTDIGNLTREQVRLEAEQDKLNERLDSKTEYLWTEYELTPSEAEAFRDDTLPGGMSGIRKHTAELKSQIKALGNVNVNAIDQYKEVSERYEFMSSQYEDLQNAEKSLQEIIEDLDRGMRKQFTESFEKIREEYDRVFKEMFGGGSGTILLAEDEDVIDAEITIISQPPGKKLQNMMQLSGGEKALSAIALIFAIQSLKPSPFCLLDEIEAALDESNVGRFAQYLKRLTDHTQFIVITHRRGTMTAADRLYGITMQEKGVSTLVSVNLVQDDLDN